MTERNFKNNLDEKEFVIAVNLNRRHLTSGQRAELGLKILEIEKERARRRQAEAGKFFGEKHPKEEVMSTSIEDTKQEEVVPTLELPDEKETCVLCDGEIIEVGGWRFCRECLKEQPDTEEEVYCKYCYQNTHLTGGDGVWECEHCGAGLYPLNGLLLKEEKEEMVVEYEQELKKQQKPETVATLMETIKEEVALIPEPSLIETEKESGKALEIAAKKVNLGKDTLWKAEKIVETAKADKQITSLILILLVF